METIIKIDYRTNMPIPFKLFHKYSSQNITQCVIDTFANRKRNDKIEIITYEIQNETPSYKQYYFDNKSTEPKIEKCNIKIMVEQPRKKAPDFEEKLSLLKTWVSKNNKIPEIGDHIEGSDIDIGKFYQSIIKNEEKINKVNETINPYIN